MRIGIKEAVAISQSEFGIGRTELADRMELSPSTARRRLSDPRALRLADFFRLGKIFGWTEEEMGEIIVGTFRDLRQRRKI